jgi:hypothetical protein
MYILICWSVAGRPGKSDLFLQVEVPILPSRTPRSEGRVKPAPPVWSPHSWATPALRPTKPANLRVANRPALLSRGKRGQSHDFTACGMSNA